VADEPVQELIIDLINAALLPVSQERGYCLCIHEFMTMIDFSGTSCAWCLQPVTKDSYGPSAKDIRTEAIKIAYPWAVKERPADA
jgi:hypothetical protein